MKKKRERVILFFSIVLVCIIFLRIPHDGEYIDTRNSNASYHTLATVKNLQDYSLDEHYLLPIVTMRNGSATEWGACLKGMDGKFYYCSFMPLDFIIPYLYFFITGLKLSVGNLYILSMLLCLISMFFLKRIVIEVFGDNKNKSLDNFVIILSYLFSYEGLHCATNVFWGELLFQPLMLAVVWCILRYREIMSKRFRTFVVLGIGIGCTLDWSAYTFAIAVILYYLIVFLRSKDRHYLKIVIEIIISVLLFSALVILHYSAKVTLNQYFGYCLERFFSRSAATNQYDVSLLALLQGYWESYGVWFIIVAIAMVKVIRDFKKDYCNEKLLIVIVIILVTCAENVLMMEHAVEYTYDRLKIAPIITLMVFSLYRGIESSNKKRFVLLIAIVALYCLRGYECGIHGYVYDNQNYSENFLLADYLKNKVFKSEDVSYENTIIGLNHYCQVRGYANLLFDCNIKESVSLGDLAQYSVNNGYDKYIYIISDYNNGSDKYHFLGFLVCDNKLDVMSYYYVEDGKVYNKIVKQSDVHAMPFSDRSFTQGVNITGSTIRFYKNEIISEKLVNASYITSDSEKFVIESITEYEDSYDIKLLGEIPHRTMKKLEFPAELKIE